MPPLPRPRRRTAKLLDIYNVCASNKKRSTNLSKPAVRHLQLIIPILILSLLPVFIGGCGGSGRPRPTGDVEWTVLVFLNADNDLETFGIQDMNEMEMVGSTDQVKIVVQFDRRPGYDTSNGDWTDTRRYLVTRDNDPQIINSTLLESMGEMDMGDPEVLREFIEWGRRTFPAKKYCVVIWNHGSGWRSSSFEGQSFESQDVLTKAVSFDDTNGSSIKTIDLPYALATTPRLDVVAFDASLMQMTEVLYEMRNVAGVIVGSEESPPGDGYPYHRWLARLVANPTMSAQALGSTIVSEYVDYYAGRASVTQSAIATDRLGDVAAAADQLAGALIPLAATQASALASARNSAQSYAFSQYKDLLDYAQQVSTRISDPTVQSATNAIATALSQAVIAEANTGTSVQGSNGLSIWIPDPAGYSQRRSSYSELQFSLNTRWDEWLASQIQ